MMNLTGYSKAQSIAGEIQQILDEIRGFNVAQLRRVYDLVNTPGEQQAVLDVMGTQGVEALGAYVALQGAMDLLEPGSVPAANTEVFVPQPDGSLLYVEPEPEVES